MKPFLCLILMAAAPLSAQVTINDLPSREFGQPLLNSPLTSIAPNLVEGRELDSPASIAFDYSLSPPAVYVADTLNNRVLGWRNSASVGIGAKADIVIGQRAGDFTSTLPMGPGRTLSTGLSLPVAVAVDNSGNLYVIDAGNNRILRYPKPFSQTGGLLPVDLVIGQKSVSSGNQANEGNGQVPSSKTLYFSSGSAFRAGLALDSQGNLWVTDPGNNRVLRFPSANLSPNLAEPGADVVVGQNDFVSYNPQQCGPDCTTTFGTNPQLNRISLIQPSGIAIDSASNSLYVADGLARVVQFFPIPTPAQPGQPANRVLGIRVAPAQPGQQPTPYPTNYTLGAANQSNQFTGSPEGIFMVGSNLFVCDTPENRVVSYDPPATWSTPNAAIPSPGLSGVFLGQGDLTHGTANRNLVRPSASSLNGPVAGAVNTVTNELWIVDSGNNRVLVFPQQQLFAASRVLGQIDFVYGSPNLVEGREVFFAQGNLTLGGGIVVDKNSNPPHLYISDTGNNRVLGFLDARKVGTDARNLLAQKADLVIGQPDLLSSLQNYSTNNLTLADLQTPSPTGLWAPEGLAVAANGDLFVADSGNGRVVRFPSPFAQPPGIPQQANLALGQSGLAVPPLKDPSQNNLSTPYGLALFNDGSLAVSDVVHNRVLIFQKPTGGFTTGQAASVVLGQTDFFSVAPGNTSASLNGPRHIATDSCDGCQGNDYLYVCDTLNNRVLVFTNPKSFSGATARLTLPGLSQPESVVVTPNTESWVASTSSNQIFRFPDFNTLQGNVQSNFQLSSFGPLALALDSFGNLIVGEASNRVSLYFPKMYYRHPATYGAGGGGSPANLTPGMLALLGRYGSDFSLAPADNQPTPWPTAGLNDVQVLVNGIPAPIYRLDQAVVYLQVPMGAPQSGRADFVVLRPSTGQILAAASFQMQQASPGIFTANQQGTGQAAAQNVSSDGTVTTNNAGTPAARGGIITLWLTGAGFIPNLPPDGTAPGAAIPTPVSPKVFINGLQATNILYSGTSAQYPGLWQINVQVPQTTPPGNTISVLVTMYDFPSNVGGTNGSNGPGPDQFLTVQNGLVPTIAVK